jgi:hypothetical protein
MKRDLLLWTPILASPAVWFVTLLANFALAPLPCSGPAETIRRGISLLALVMIGAAGLLAWWLWKRNRADPLPAQGAPVERVRAMALSGVVLSAGFFLVILAQSLPDFMLTGCE